MTQAILKAINQELSSLKQADFIKPSNSLFASPIVYVMKKDKTIWVCIDFRKVNHNIVNNTCSLRRMEDQLEAMRGSRVFKTLELTKGYHQLQLDEESREIILFTMPKGLFQWKVLPMDMKTLGAVFQRLMDELLREL